MTNRKTTKRALLSSILALVLCFAMLLGTTFAWFTDTASTNVNKIQAGTLDVQLLDKEGKSLEGKTLSWQKAADGAEPEVLWEPGCTYKLEPITIKNNGNLALKYKIEVTGIGGDTKLNEAIEWSFSVTSNEVATHTGEDQTIVNGLTERSLSAGASDTLTISGHMKETAGNEYQSLSIESAAITVYATQWTEEYDSTTNQYDASAEYADATANAPVVWDGHSTEAPTTTTDDDGNTVYHISTAAQLMEVMIKSQNYSTTNVYYKKTIVLDNNIDLGGATVTGFGNDTSHFYGNFDGQGYTISNFTATNNGATYTGLFNYVFAGSSIKNLTVKNATILGSGKGMAGAVISAIYGDSASTVENCHAINCSVYGQKKVGGVIGYANNGVTVSNCSATNCNIYCEVGENVESAGIKPQASAVLGFDHNATTSNLTETGCNVYFGYKEVSSASDLASALDNTGNSPTSSRTIVLTADIDAMSWTAITGGSNYPAVTIDGNGHTISNLSDCLFSKLPGHNYVFKNINFTNVNLTASSSSDAGIGVLVGEGMANGGGSYTITNCHINGGTIDGGSTKYVGGFIGFKSSGADVTFTDCSVKNLTLKSSEKSIGAFAGHLYDTVTFTNCAVKGTTSVTHSGDREGGAAKAGILVGTTYGATVTNCTVDSSVSLSNNNADPPLNGNLFGRNPDNKTITVN